MPPMLKKMENDSKGKPVICKYTFLKMVPISLVKWAIIAPSEQLHWDGLPCFYCLNGMQDPSQYLSFKVEFFAKIISS